MRKNKLTSLLAIGASLIFPIASAHAHFLWGSVTPGPEPIYRLTLSETPLEGTDADHTKQARDASAWSVGGKDLELTHTEEFFVAPLTSEAKIIAAGYSWGVFPNRGQKQKGSHLLDLYAKAAATEAAAANSAGLPLEVFARRDGTEFVATVKADGKRLAGAEVVVVAPEGVEKNLKTDSSGSVRFPFTQAGLYTVRAVNVVTPRQGAHNGKRYESVLGFSTLTFTAAQSPTR